MKFNLSDFVQLDTKGLLTVNGGYNCNGSSNTTVYSNPYYSGNNGGGNGHGGGGSGNGNGNGGGGCGKTTTPPADDAGNDKGNDNNSDSNKPTVEYRPDDTKITVNPDGSRDFDYPDGRHVHYPAGDSQSTIKDKSSTNSDNDSNDGNAQSKTDIGVGSGGGTCSGGSSSSEQSATTVPSGPAVGGGSSSGGSTGDPVETTNGNGTNDGPNTPSEITDDDHLICFVPSKEHCDIIAWNHAVDAGLNPRGKDGTDWNANGKNVDEIFKMHFVDKAVDFDGKQAGKMGYILYDWEGDGKYDHIEFGMISEDGLSYSFYNNQGFEYQDKYSTRTFAQDPNAGAKPDSPGSVRFIPLN